MILKGAASYKEDPKTTGEHTYLHEVITLDIMKCNTFCRFQHPMIFVVYGIISLQINYDWYIHCHP